MRSFILIGLLSCSPAGAQAIGQTAPPTNKATASSYLSGWTPYMELSLWRAYDAVPVSEIERDWSNGFSPRDGRNTMLQRNRASIGVEKDRWRFGWEIRQEARLTTNKQTLEFVHLYKQRLKPSAPVSFDLHAKYTGWSAQGLRVGRSFDGPLLAGRAPRLNISAAYYDGQPRLRDSEISGSVHYARSDQYQFNVSQYDANHRFQYPFMQHSPSASGMSISVGADWALSDALSLHVKIEDLWSRMRWKNLPVTQQTVDSAVGEYDGDGYINYRPLLNGTHRQVGKSLTIARSGAATLAYRLGAWRFATQIERYAGETIPTLSVAHQFGWGTLTANAETRFKTVGLGFERGNFRVMLQSDSLQLDQAKAQAVHLSYRYTF